MWHAGNSWASKSVSSSQRAQWEPLTLHMTTEKKHTWCQRDAGREERERWGRSALTKETAGQALVGSWVVSGWLCRVCSSGTSVTTVNLLHWSRGSWPTRRDEAAVSLTFICTAWGRQRAASHLAHARTHTHSDSLTHTDTLLPPFVWLTDALETLRTGGQTRFSWSPLLRWAAFSLTHTHIDTLAHTHWTGCHLWVLRTLSGDKRSSLWLWLSSSSSFVCT